MSHITNPLASSAQLVRCQTRMAALGQPAELLDVVFFAVQCLTQAAGLLLELPQSTTARACVVLARYWLVVPGFLATADGDGDDGIDYLHVSAAALYVVAKTGAAPRSARDLANVYAYLGATVDFWGCQTDRDDDARDRSRSYLADAAYVAFHDRVLALEARLLCALGFDTHVALPHPLAITYLQAMDFLAVDSSNNNNSKAPADAGSPAHTLARRAVAYLNTALLSPQLLYLTHQPHELAVAAVYSAARDGACHLPPGTPWWLVFDVDRETLGFLAVALRSVASWADTLQRSPSSLLTGGIVTRRRVAEAAAAWETIPS
ncbi:cyclin domain containing protein [Grosmannia clavigera kw1407]|uniref:Cyclin domain containing protein n=1 Tax=Grosmannia clavigera (strain kw1407 / UAMH 11150) TaxID=655863 RepID=F0X8L2_GROCL|nr:cyclin domain containing protein [Grosmannia clavigera kw1407]EFX05583.1 cyclin domain containing protein [Grosmannia clavigera kw1407]